MTPGTRSYAGGVTTPVSTESGPSVVKMTPAAIDALHKLGQSQAGSVARAIAAIGKEEGKPLVTREDREYLAMVPKDDEAPVVMYRESGSGGFLVTGLVDRDAYETYEVTDGRGPQQSNAIRTAVSAAVGLILGSRSGRKPSSG
jgi:hypothetical protein